MRKTTFALPEDLWKAAKIAALEDGRDLADVIVDALTRYLKARRQKKGGRS